MAKDFNDGKRLGLFAATPPLEAIRMQASEAATMDRGQHQEEKVIMVNDVARAFFEAPMTRELCVELLEEAKDGEDWDKDMVGLL